MKISTTEVSRLLAVSPQGRAQRQQAESVRQESGTTPATLVEFTTTAQEVQQVKRWLQDVPDAREERVQALKAQVESGTYHVSGEDIADLIIRRTLADNTAL